MANKTPDGIHNYAIEIDKIEIKEKIYKVFMYQGTFYIKLPECIVNGKTLKETRKRVLAKLSRNKVRLNIPGMMFCWNGGRDPEFVKITIKGIHGQTKSLEIIDHREKDRIHQSSRYSDDNYFRTLPKKAQEYYIKLVTARSNLNDKLKKFNDKYEFDGRHEAREAIDKILAAKEGTK